MAPTLWGLDLAEIHPRKFASSYMWNKVYHLRRTKFIVYQLAMILCVISESVGTAALSNYRDQSSDIKRLGLGAGAGEWSGDWIGVASYNIFNGIYVAFIFGAAFFFDLIWPERREDRGIRNAYKWTAISTIFTTLASAIAMTVIFATHRSAIRGTPEQAAAIDRYIAENGKDPLNYMDNTLIKVSIAFIWPGFLACIASTIVLWKSDAYIERNGPWTRSELAARLAQTSGTPPYSPSETNLVASSLPGSPGYNWHDEKLKDPKRGGGPTVSPVAGSNGTGKKVEAAEIREGKEVV